MALYTGVTTFILFSTLFLAEIVYRISINDSLIKGKKIFTYLGVIFFFIALSNFVNSFLYKVSNLRELRYIFIILLTAITLIFFQKRNIVLDKILIKLCHFIFIANLAIILIEIFLYYFYFNPYLEAVISFQQWLTSEAHSVVGITRKIAIPIYHIFPEASAIIRPMGLFGGIHSSLYILFIYLLMQIMVRVDNTINRYFVWFLLLLIGVCLNGGQAFICLLGGIFVYEWLNLNKKNKITFVILIFLIIVPLAYNWLMTQDYLNKNNPRSMFAVFQNSWLILRYFPQKSCYLFGCSLSPASIEHQLYDIPAFVREVRQSGFLFLGLDNGIIAMLLSYGFLFILFYVIGIILVLKFNVWDIKIKKISVSILTFQFITIIHYPIGWSAGIFAFTMMVLVLAFNHYYKKEVKIYSFDSDKPINSGKTLKLKYEI